MASEKKRKRTTQKMKTYENKVSYKKSSPRDNNNGPINMKDVRSCLLLDDKKLVSDIKKMGVVCNDNVGSSSRSVVNNNNNNSFDIIKSMKQDDHNAAWVFSAQITQVKFMPTPNMRMLVFGNEFGNIGFWNMDHQMEDAADKIGIYVYYPHPAFISGLSINPFSLSKIISSCYNGYIRVLDVERESFDLAYKSDELITSICGSPYNNDMNSLFFGESNGDVSTLDLRCSSSRPTRSWSLHEDKVYTLDINSQNTNILATASKDHTARIWDLRKLDNNSKPLQTIKHDHHVNSAYFSPSGIYLATTSKDDCIGIVDAKSYDVECMLYHYNHISSQTTNNLSIRGIWGWDDCHIMVANLGKKGVDIVSANEQRLLYTLESRRINAIPRRLAAHPMIPGLLAGSTTGGRIYVWDT